MRRSLWKPGLIACAAAAAGLVFLYLFAGWPSSGGGRKSGDDVVRLLDGVDLSDGDYALILENFVTGSGSRLIADEEWIAAMADDLWYRRETGVGPVIGQSILTLMGMPAFQHIGTLLRDGAAVEKFDCLSVSCINWGSPDAREGMWGMGHLRGIEPPPGTPVRQTFRSFGDYDAYREAHAAVARDPVRHFADPGGEVLADPDSGMREIIADIPSEILRAAPYFVWRRQEGKETEALRRIAGNWLEGTGGEVTEITVSGRTGLRVLHEGKYLYRDAQDIIYLPGLSVRNSRVRLSVPKDGIETVRSRISETPFRPPDRAPLLPALNEAFAAGRVDPACLPACGGVDEAQIHDETKIFVEGDPVWRLSVWELAP